MSTTIGPPPGGSGNQTIAGTPIGGEDYQRVLLAKSDGTVYDEYPVKQPEVSATGTIAALNDAVSLALRGPGGASVTVTGTGVGTITQQVSLDGVNWVAIVGR